MSFIIYVSKQWVQIPQYDIKASLSAPSEKISSPTNETIQILKHSLSLLEDSTRAEKDEVIQLFKAYGYRLFQNLFPEKIRSHVLREACFYIYTLDEFSDSIPWELLHDSNSFLSLSHGIIRINEGANLPDGLSSSSRLRSLKIALTSSTPIFKENSESYDRQSGYFSDRFITVIEDIAQSGLIKSDAFEFDLNPALNENALFSTLNKNPSIFLFSGYGGDKYWILEHDSISTPKSIFFKELQPRLTESLSNQLKLLILITSSQLENTNERSFQQCLNLFQYGVPFIICINGKIGRNRIQQYLQNLFLQLGRNETIMSAHRHALNYIYSSMSLSWDWCWIQLRFNKELLKLENAEELTVFPVEIVDNNPKQIPSFLSRRRFRGNFETLSSVFSELSQNNTQKIICLYNSFGLEAETYVREYLRKIVYRKKVIVKSFNYFHNFSSDQISTENDKYIDLLENFNFLENAEITQSYYEESLTNLNTPCSEEEAFQKILIVFSSPKSVNTSFDNWIAKKQSAGWLIIILSNSLNFTRKPITIIPISSTKKKTIFNLFEDELPEIWLRSIEKNQFLPQNFQNLTLLKTVKNFRSPELTQLICKIEDTKLIWEEVFRYFFTNFSADIHETFIVLFIFKNRCDKTLLEKCVEIENLNNIIDQLNFLQLIEVSLSGNEIWTPYFINLIIEEHQLVPPKYLASIVDKIASKILTLFEEKKYQDSLISVVAGLIHNMSKSDNPQIIKRCLQFSKALVKFPFENFQAHFLILNRIAIQLAIASDNPETIEETILNSMDILERGNIETNAIEIYEWFLSKAGNSPDWKQISKVQSRLAKLYSKTGEIEKAISLLTSVLSLNSDIKDHSERYNIMIQIALLLLENKNFQRVEDTLLSIQFDPELLSKSNIAKLWIIDGHLKYQSGDTDSALKSLVKGLDSDELNISENIFNESFKLVIDVLEKANSFEHSSEWAEKAAFHFNSKKEYEKANHYHRKLYKFYLKKNLLNQAISHLEAIYLSLKEKQKSDSETEELREVLNQMGGVFFKLGEQTKSTEFYKKALEF